MYNSLKQIFRTPLRTFFFILLLILTALLASLGSNLWFLSKSSLKEYSNTFSTIATVEQKKTSVAQEKIWNAEKKDYDFFNHPQYDASIPISVLEFEEANYVLKPEKRPYYEAYLPEYKIWSNTGGYNNVWKAPIIVEVSPIEDCVPDHPVELRVEKVFYSDTSFNSNSLKFCDHNNKSPDKLYADKSYIMCLNDRPAHAGEIEGGIEYTIGGSVEGVQYNKYGEKISSNENNNSYEEIGNNFYSEGGRWQTWKAYVRQLGMIYSTVPVTPTHSTNLLMPFYSGDAYIIEGTDFTAKEYEEGEKLCLVEKWFADNNNLSIGDDISLPLYTANYKNSAGATMGYFNTSLNGKGEIYSIFSNQNYKISGIYDTAPKMSIESKYQMGNCEIIVPWNSIKESDENNIVAYGPMMGYTTSFQIPNGAIEDYLKIWEKQDVKGLDITFYDKGYTQLKDGLTQMKEMALILLVTGIVTTILILLFFCHLFISKQKERTAIERSLGMSKRQCRTSILSGIMTIVIVGSMTGSILGLFFTQKAVQQFGEKCYYDTTYSSGQVGGAGKQEKTDIVVYPQNSTVIVIVTEVGIILLAYVISTVAIRKNLRYDILKLLGEKRN